jgi:hypothetical protein
MKTSSLSTAQIGASGVLLIQYRLLKCGIESAPMTTDAGIDLVAYSPKMKRAVTIQVKTCLRPKPAGGKGQASLDWWLPKASPAELVGLANLESDQAWLFRHDEFVARSQQQPLERLHLYFYINPDHSVRPGCHERDFEQFTIKSRMGDIFGIPEGSPMANTQP